MWLHTFLADIISVINSHLFLEVYSNILETTTARKKSSEDREIWTQFKFLLPPFHHYLWNKPPLGYIHTYTLLMLPKWAFQLNRIKKYKYIN